MRRSSSQTDRHSRIVPLAVEYRIWSDLAKTPPANCLSVCLSVCDRPNPGWDRAKGAERPTWYTHSDLHQAWSLLIDAADECKPSKAYAYDLVDVGREWLSIAPCNDAYDALLGANTTAAVGAANASMATVMSDLDRLLAASDGFLFGQWIADARKLAASEGADAKDADFLEWNARSQVTSWFPVDGEAGHADATCTGTATKLDGLWDYGNKAWAVRNPRPHVYARLFPAQLSCCICLF